MAKTKNQNIFIVIIIIVALLYFLPKLGLFVILPAGECNFNSEQNFLTNINYGEVETIDDYYTFADKNLGGWISVDWNRDGQLESYGNPQIQQGDISVCSGKTLIIQTVSGLKVIQFEETSVYNTVAICPSTGGKIVLFYSNSQEADAKTSINQCTNYNPPIIEYTNNTYCSSDALRCEDGSYVSRNSSNNCQFNPCPVVDLSCTKDKYITCSNGVNYKYQSCINGTLRTINYLVNPCNTNVNVTNCTYNYSAWSSCNNVTLTQTRNYTVTQDTCVGEPVITQTCTVSTSFWSQELFKIGEFSIKIWMLVALVSFIILLFLLTSK